MNKIPKKIGTISLNINTPDFNYGAILHSWAFQKFLIKERLCENTEIIDYITPSLESYDRNRPIINALKNKKIKSFIKNIIIYRAYKKRLKKFTEFTKNHMIISSKHYTQKELENSDLDYDTVICESDVIWSPGFFGGNFDRTFFMDLESMKHMKKIAYAPSMANGDLNENQKKEMKKLLESVDFISCRETYEKEILEELTPKNVEHVLDPVMLLEEKDYSEIVAERIIKDKYILLYLPVDNNKKLRKAAIQYAKDNNLKILEITTKCIHILGGKTLVSAGVQEFLSAIKYAETIFTNSFHAICFSLIFNKQFYAFSRNYYGKVKNICDVVGVNDRFFENDNFKILEEIDYLSVNKNIENLKQKSITWIKDAICKEGV